MTTLTHSTPAPRRLREQVYDRLGEISAPHPTLLDRIRNELLGCRADLLRDRRHALRRLRARQLVHLREHDDRRYLDVGEELEHLEIVPRGIMTTVEQLHHSAQLRTAAQKALD